MTEIIIDFMDEEQFEECIDVEYKNVFNEGDIVRVDGIGFGKITNVEYPDEYYDKTMYEVVVYGIGTRCYEGWQLAKVTPDLKMFKVAM